MKKLLSVLSCFLFISLSAQTIISVGKTSRWAQYDDDLSFESVDMRRYTPKSKLLRITDNEVVFPVSYDNSSGVFVFDQTKLTYGVVKLNSKGQELWQQKTAGLLIDIGRVGKNIIVISTDQKLQRHVAKQIRLTVLDGTDGKVLQQKILLTNPTEYFIEIKAFNKRNGDFMALMVRYSNYKGGLALGAYKKFQQSNKIELYSLTENLEAKLERTIASEEKLKYWRSEMANNGNLFLLYENDDDAIIVDKYASKEINAVRLSTPYKIEPQSKQRFLISVNANNDEQLACAMNGVKFIRYAIFQFDKKNVIVKDEALTDDYAAELNATVPESEDFEKRKKMKHIQWTEVKYLNYYNGNLVVAKEISKKEMEALPTDYETIVSVFDESITAKKHFVVPKEYSAGKVGVYGDSYYIGGDLFHYLSNHNHKISKDKFIYACIDLKNLQLKKLNFLRDTNKKVVFDTPLIPTNTIWFQENFIIDRRDFHFAKGISSNTNLEVVNYE